MHLLVLYRVRNDWNVLQFIMQINCSVVIFVLKLLLDYINFLLINTGNHKCKNQENITEVVIYHAMIEAEFFSGTEEHAEIVNTVIFSLKYIYSSREDGITKQQNREPL